MLRGCRITFLDLQSILVAGAKVYQLLAELALFSTLPGKIIVVKDVTRFILPTL